VDDRVLGANLGHGSLRQSASAGQQSVTEPGYRLHQPRIETLLKLAAALGVTFEVDGSGVRVRRAA